MRVSELIELSGIAEQTGYQTHDTAVPMDCNGNYPHNGNAIAVYYDKRLLPQIISYRDLAQMAFDRGIYLARWQRECLRDVVNQREDQL